MFSANCYDCTVSVTASHLVIAHRSIPKAPTEKVSEGSGMHMYTAEQSPDIVGNAWNN